MIGPNTGRRPGGAKVRPTYPPHTRASARSLTLPMPKLTRTLLTVKGRGPAHREKIELPVVRQDDYVFSEGEGAREQGFTGDLKELGRARAREPRRQGGAGRPREIFCWLKFGLQTRPDESGATHNTLTFDREGAKHKHAPI